MVPGGEKKKGWTRGAFLDIGVHVEDSDWLVRKGFRILLIINFFFLEDKIHMGHDHH